MLIFHSFWYVYQRVTYGFVWTYGFPERKLMLKNHHRVFPLRWPFFGTVYSIFRLNQSHYSLFKSTFWLVKLTIFVVTITFFLVNTILTVGPTVTQPAPFVRVPSGVVGAASVADRAGTVAGSLDVGEEAAAGAWRIFGDPPMMVITTIQHEG